LTSIIMKVLESSPSRYDRGIRIITFGKDIEIKRKIVSNYVSKGVCLLDVGVGTGTLAILCAQRGAYVFGFDVLSKMLEIAREKIRFAGLENMVHLEEMSVMEMDTHLKDNSFDVVTLTLVLSELSEAEQIFTLKQCYRVLRPNGLLIIEDEVRPKSLKKKILYYLVRFPLALLTYIVSQSLTKPVKEIERKLSEVGFKNVIKLLRVKDFLILCIVIIGMGAFNGISTWIEKILGEHGVSQIDAGLIGGLIVIGGIFGSIAIPALSAKMGKRKIFAILAIAGSIPPFIALALTGNLSILYASAFYLGFVMLPALPILLD